MLAYVMCGLKSVHGSVTYSSEVAQFKGIEYREHQGERKLHWCCTNANCNNRGSLCFTMQFDVCDSTMWAKYFFQEKTTSLCKEMCPSFPPTGSVMMIHVCGSFHFSLDDLLQFSFADISTWRQQSQTRRKVQAFAQQVWKVIAFFSRFLQCNPTWKERHSWCACT